MLRQRVKYYAAQPWSVLKAIYKPFTLRGKADITVLTEQEGGIHTRNRNAASTGNDNM